MNWTQEQRDEMIRLWDNGRRSYSEIARIMGMGKNAIVGRMRREKRLRGLPVEDKYAHPRKSGQPRKPKEKKMITLPQRAGYIIVPYKAPTVPKPDEGQLASIVDVTGCRWPVRDDEAYIGGVAFCNHSTDGGSYCPYHAHESKAAYSRALINKTTRDAIWAYGRKAA